MTNRDIVKGNNISIGNFYIAPLLEDSVEDFEIYKSIMTDPSIIKSVSLFNKSIPNEKLMVDDYKIKTFSHKKWGIGFCKIMKEDTHECMGMAGPIVMGENDGLPTEVELGVYILKKFQGKSLAYQSLFLSTFNALKKYKSIDKIWGTALGTNLASQSIMLRGGLKYAGFKTRDNGAVVQYFESNREDLLFNAINRKLALFNVNKALKEINSI